MNRRRTRGFTLLEVMVAMAILATVMIVLLENHGASVRMTEKSRQVSIAINLAKDLMTDLETEGWPEIGEYSGDFNELYPGLYPGFRWEREVIENNFWSYVRECYIRVFWLDGSFEQKVELTQYIAATDNEQQEIAEDESSASEEGADDDATGSTAGGLTGGTEAQ